MSSSTMTSHRKTGPIRLCLVGPATATTMPDTSDISFSWIPATDDVSLTARFGLTNVPLTPASVRRYKAERSAEDVAAGISMEFELPIAEPITGSTVTAIHYHQGASGTSAHHMNIPSHLVNVTRAPTSDGTVGEPTSVTLTFKDSNTSEMKTETFSLSESLWRVYDVSPSVMVGDKFMVGGKSLTNNRIQVTVGGNILGPTEDPFVPGATNTVYPATWVEMFFDDDEVDAASVA